MPWSVSSPMSRRLEFVEDARRGLYSMTELCARYAISRRVGYKWLARFEAEGADGLVDQRRVAKSHPHRMVDDVAARLLATAAHRVAGRQLGGRAAQAGRAGARPTPATDSRPPRSAHRTDGRAERHVDRGLQGPVPHAGWLVLLSAHGLRRLLALPARVPRAPVDGGRGRPARLRAPLPRARAAGAHPQRQRRAVRDHRARASRCGGCASASCRS
jgi:hypothetical protein